MKLQMLVSGMQLNIKETPAKMNLQADSIIINQCDKNAYDEFEYNGHKMQFYSFAEKGVGLSRNNALLRATGDIVLFSDEDIVYDDGYAKAVIKAFEEHPDAEMLLFNFEVTEERFTYFIQSEHRVHLWNCGRYPAYSFACRREALHKTNITYNLLFGGGAKYSNGEDSLFIAECIKKGLRIYAVPVKLGVEVPRPSTWFNGYTDKFFFDRGVLYSALYGKLEIPMAMRFLVAKRNVMLKDRKIGEAYRLMRKGMREYKER